MFTINLNPKGEWLLLLHKMGLDSIKIASIH